MKNLGRRRRATLEVVAMVSLLVCATPRAWAQTSSAAATDPSWTVRLSGVLQKSTGAWENWYTTNPTARDGESAANGIQGTAAGVDAALEYQATRRVWVGAAFGYVPTRLNAEVHRTAQNRFAIPNAHLAFMPLRFTATADLARRPSWTVRAGGQVGVGLFGSTDVTPEFGRARYFSGDNRLLVGGHVGFVYTMSSGGWRVGISLQYQRTRFKVSELGTGAFPDDLEFGAVSLLFGIDRPFGHRGR